MTQRDARFYFANLGADIARCIAAAQENNSTRYASSLSRAYTTLAHMRRAQRPEAYEEGLLLLRALEYARERGVLEEFREQLNRLIARIAPSVAR